MRVFLWIPRASYYVERKTNACHELNGLNWRSVLFGYLRVWLPAAVVIALLFARAPLSDRVSLGGMAVAISGPAATSTTSRCSNWCWPRSRARPDHRGHAERRIGCLAPYISVRHSHSSGP